MARVRVESAGSLVPLSLLLLLVVLPPSLSSSTPQCRLDYTGLALLSCQETPPQSPTRSCCDALLFAVDIWPSSILDKGVCCLCVYVVARRPTFDLAGAYVACGGKDAAAVQAWKVTAAPDCNDPCGLDGPPTPPRSPPSGGGGVGGGLGPGATAAVVFGSLAGGAALVGLGWWIYRSYFSAAAKDHISPDPSNRSSDRQQGAVGGGALEMMPRLSSARRSTSTLLD